MTVRPSWSISVNGPPIACGAAVATASPATRKTMPARSALTAVALAHRSRPMGRWAPRRSTCTLTSRAPAFWKVNVSGNRSPTLSFAFQVDEHHVQPAARRQLQCPIGLHRRSRLPPDASASSRSPRYGCAVPPFVATGVARPVSRSSVGGLMRKYTAPVVAAPGVARAQARSTCGPVSSACAPASASASTSTATSQAGGAVVTVGAAGAAWGDGRVALRQVRLQRRRSR